MDMERLLASVRSNEGYRNKVYLDTLGKRTVGVGHLCVEDFWEDDKEYDEEFLMEILEKDLENAISGAEELLGEYTVHDHCKEILVEMVFQLGKTGVKQFRNMWASLKEKDFVSAAAHMKDSRWRKQTPKRCESLSELVANA